MAKLATEEAVLPTDEMTYEVRKLHEVVDLLWLPKGLGEAERNARVLRALELYEGLEPEGAAEGMLAAQMVGTHTAALECLRRAALPDQTFEGREMALKHAQKLMTLYTQQMATLDKRRGRGQQKVTVEHVHVHAGGQAIVGTVEAQGNAAPPAMLALEDAKELPLDVSDARVPVRRSGRAKR